MRICTKCRCTKARSAFRADKSRSDGIYPYCRECDNLRRRDSKRQSAWTIDRLVAFQTQAAKVAAHIAARG